jgi:hypothetical protein
MVQIGTGLQIAEVSGGGEPIGLLPLEAESQVLLGGDGGIVLGNAAAKEPPAKGGGVDVLAYDSELIFGKGYSAHEITSKYISCVLHTYS